jgi:hypothetical protein
MATITSVTTARVRDGKMQEALAVYGKVKKGLERLGGKVRVLSQAFGAAPLTISIIVEHSSWAEFGAASAKAETDSELQALLASLRANPISDLVGRSVFTELDV